MLQERLLRQRRRREYRQHCRIAAQNPPGPFARAGGFLYTYIIGFCNNHRSIERLAIPDFKMI